MDRVVASGGREHDSSYTHSFLPPIPVAASSSKEDTVAEKEKGDGTPRARAMLPTRALVHRLVHAAASFDSRAHVCMCVKIADSRQRLNGYLLNSQQEKREGEGEEERKKEPGCCYKDMLICYSPFGVR